MGKTCSKRWDSNPRPQVICCFCSVCSSCVSRHWMYTGCQFNVSKRNKQRLVEKNIYSECEYDRCYITDRFCPSCHFHFPSLLKHRHCCVSGSFNISSFHTPAHHNVILSLEKKAVSSTLLSNRKWVCTVSTGRISPQSSMQIAPFLMPPGS